jgi:hypothetical protein
MQNVILFAVFCSKLPLRAIDANNGRNGLHSAEQSFLDDGNAA